MSTTSSLTTATFCPETKRIPRYEFPAQAECWWVIYLFIYYFCFYINIFIQLEVVSLRKKNVFRNGIMRSFMHTNSTQYIFFILLFRHYEWNRQKMEISRSWFQKRSEPLPDFRWVTQLSY